MNARTTRARHRAARRPLTPLSELAQSVTSSTTGRRAAVVATAGGLLVSTFASSAQAAPLQHAPVPNDAANKLSTVDLGALTEQAREALEAAPVVTVAADAKVVVENVDVQNVAKAITPAPEPEPEPEPVVTKASRSSSSGSSSTSSSSSASSSASVPASASGSAIVSIAARYIGTPYVVGGASPAGFDCSGLVQYVYAQVGISLPHSSSGIRNSGNVTVISRAEAKPGDLIWSPGHIAIYIGGNQQIDASRPDGWDTRIRDIWQSAPVFLRVTG